ncbi:MAG: conjugal transfer protein TraX [Oscillospiraceae bacterium]|nr:conjugal transfer protein TraX [Oscillospiraceae bacterium]
MKNFKFSITSTSLHIMAMIFMLCDHLWATVISGNDWLNSIGRIAFPIFAFLVVEGYFHSKNLKKYLLRLLVFAIISEIPFNFMISGRWVYPLHQNVLVTFFISLLLIMLNEKVKTRHILLRLLAGIVSLILAVVLGIVTFCDYYHAGVLTVLVFYFFKERRWWCYICQFICLYFINVNLLGGIGYDVVLFGKTFFIARQSFALLALIPIWLYNGKQGYYNKILQYSYYIFYPLHIAVLAVIMIVL